MTLYLYNHTAQEVVALRDGDRKSAAIICAYFRNPQVYPNLPPAFSGSRWLQTDRCTVSEKWDPKYGVYNAIVRIE